ncbi:MAG: hypothetical protein LW824_18820 [Algoriphagus sp.]|nr:hypothetical protein [Algoriphagus sp.]MCE2779630.1 hypothetical protein [Algoriphagus sp.]
MENDSLEFVQTFLEDSIFLLPEDREKIEQSLFGTSESLVANETAEVEKSADLSAGTPEVLNLPEEIQSAPVLDPIQVKGNFTKGILVLHEESNLNSEVMDMLVKMLNACGHSMTEVGLLAAESLENRSMEDFQALNAHVVLKFGRVKHPINQLPINSYEIHTEGETEYLFADALTSISEDKTLKRQLWTTLQLLFNLSTGSK